MADSTQHQHWEGCLRTHLVVGERVGAGVGRRALVLADDRGTAARMRAVVWDLVGAAFVEIHPTA